MKKLFTITIMLAVIGLSVNAQWTKQTSGTTNALNSVYFANAHFKKISEASFGIFSYSDKTSNHIMLPLMNKNNITEKQINSVSKKDRDDDDKAWHSAQMVLGLGIDYGSYKSTSSGLYTSTFISKSTISSVIYNFLSYESALYRQPYIGIGFKIRLRKYNLGNIPKDINQTGTPDARSLEVLAQLNIHVVRTKKLDVPMGFMYGLSAFKYIANDLYNTIGSVKGGAIDVHVNPRYYFNDHFGVNLYVAYAQFFYSDIKLTSTVIGTPLNFLSATSMNLSGSGFNIGAEIQYKFR